MESVLSLREKEVLYLRYGLPGGTELTQKEVGKRLGISRSYVSRIENERSCAYGMRRGDERLIFEKQQCKSSESECTKTVDSMLWHAVWLKQL